MAMAWIAAAAWSFPASGCQPRTEAPDTEWHPSFPEVGIDGEWLTVGGERFLVVGVGYEIGARPGRVPWDRDYRPELLHADFKRIVEAGFNTIRTWAPMTDAEIAIARSYGLWIIMGLWIDPAADFGDPAFREESFAFCERELTRLGKHPNILFYLLLNEPHADAVYRSGFETVNDFYRELVEIARRSDPDRFVSYSNCVMTDFMEPAMFDLVAQNVYPYSPTTIQQALGYRTYLEVIKARLTDGKPMIVTEFGLSVSPTGDGRGYGGNSLEEQRGGVVRLWDDVLNAGCAGGCVFMWIDGWWKRGDEDTHNDHAEEWYGLLEADSDYVGRPRPVYFALKEYNRFIRTRPADGETVDRELPVEVWAPEAESVDVVLGDRPAVPMRKDGNWWWRAILDTATLSLGEYTVAISAHLPDGRSSAVKTSRIFVDRSGRVCHPPLQVLIDVLAERITAEDPIPIEVKVTDCDGHPVAGQPVRIDRFVHTAWNEWGVDLQTEANGVARANLAPIGQPGVLSIAAGTPYRMGSMERRAGDYVHLEIMSE